ncbi:putative tRNA methyltransferase 9B [Frankliniella fusca]|uniref:tRNA methyltransferase 9B n=1 Tax=Frankliniella fusca TaxID=407009 RepID=A0AAE1GWC3_9NEOP|nr:putative tRNA methyltransferase 9B [Frankliniella fusca]
MVNFSSCPDDTDPTVAVMAGGGGGGEARSVALETAYVHEVYEEISGASSSWNCNCCGCAPNPSGRAWPKVAQFLHDLEPGALVCDVGCGNGKYLSINPSVFKIGVDRCLSLTELAREKEHEVLVCDNLALPFRDECFDAVLSVAVVHHLATTERRVSAIRELARVLRIGGRLIITVWAMEQRHRKFESQDVLVPWHRPQQLSTPSLELTSTTTTSEEDLHPPYHAYTQTSDSDSCRSASRSGGGGQQRRRRHRGHHGHGQGRSIDTGRAVSASHSSSSLSSPNETCYSFVRRALQKLAGSKRSAPWFLESWAQQQQQQGPGGHRDPAGLRRHEPEGCEDCNDIQDLPIELRRLEEDLEPQGQGQGRSRSPSHLPLHLKSKSLSDILCPEPADSLVRSRSSVPSLALGPGLGPGPGPAAGAGSALGALPGLPGLAGLHGLGEAQRSQHSSSSSVCLSHGSKPRLVKQKQSMCEEEAEAEVEQEEAAGGDQPTDMRNLVRALPDFKRLHGGAGHVLGRSALRSARLNVFKQSSMNEELMSAERLREKERVRQNIQKQASLNEELMYRHRPGAGAPGTLDSLRDTLFSASTAKRFQLLKIGLTSKLKSSTTNIEKVAGTSLKNGFVRMLQGWKQAGEASPMSSPAPSRQASCTTPSVSGSLTPSTPPPDMYGLKRPSSGSINGADDMRARSSSGGSEGGRRHSREDGSDSSKDSSLQSDTSVDSEDSFASVIFIPKAEQFMGQDALGPKTPSPTLCTSAPASPQLPPPTSPKVLLYSGQHSPHTSPPQLPSSPRLGPGPMGPLSPLPLSVSLGPHGHGHGHAHAGPSVPVLPVLPPARAKDHESRLQQIKEMLSRQKTGSGGRGMFPLVRRSSGSLPRPAPPRSAPRLLSLELFNPETDDVDSDSSGVSSPDSVDSVISVANNNRSSAGSSDGSGKLAPAPGHDTISADPEDSGRSVSRTPSPAPERLLEPPPVPPRSQSPSGAALGPAAAAARLQPHHSTSTPASLSLLEAAADVATTLEDAVEAVIQASPRARRRQVNLDSADLRVALEDDLARSSWSLQLSPDNSPNPTNRTKSRMKESVSRFSLPGSLAAARGQQENTVFKFPQTISVGKPDSLRSCRRADSAGRLHEGAGVDYTGLGAVPRRPGTDPEQPFTSKPFITEPEPDPLTLTAIPETPDPFGLHAAQAGQLQSPGVAPAQGLSSADHSPSRRSVPPLVLSPREGQVADGSAGLGSPLEEDCWDEGVRQHLAGFAEQLSERLLEEIERYREDGAVRDLARLGEELQGLSKLSLELRERPSAPGPFDKVLASLAKNVDSSCELLSRLTKNASLPSLRSVDSSEALTGVSSLSSSIRSTRSTDGDSAPPSELASEASDAEASVSAPPPSSVAPPPFAPPRPSAVLYAAAAAADSDGGSGDQARPSGLMTPLRPGCSIESSDGGDFSERTGTGSVSGTDSRRDTSSASASHGITASSASLASAMESMSDAYDAASDCSRDVRFADRRTARCDGRSSSEETPGRMPQLVRQKAAVQEPAEVTKTESCTTSLSGSTSQDSLPSDNGGGAITYHRYYHVFREGELDQLIERYVENLHIISSYYDHTNWCVVAEKVQVWTI